MEELTLRDLDKLDVIELANDELNKITNWCLKNQDKITLHTDNIKHIFNEGIIKIKNIDFLKEATIILYFKVIYSEEIKENVVEFSSYLLINSSLHYCFSVIPYISLYRFLKTMFTNDLCFYVDFEVNNKVTSNNEIPSSQVKETLLQYYSILIYSQFNQEQVIRQTKTHTKKIQSKKDKRAGKKPKVKLIKQNIIRLNTDHIPELTEEERKHYERHTFGWTVRGHWRTYQSGKKVWIKPQIRGDKDMVEGKVYEI